MKLKYRRVKMLVPYCPECNQNLSGNNSVIFPYKCDCGELHNSFENPFEYEIVKLAETKKE